MIRYELSIKDVQPLHNQLQVELLPEAFAAAQKQAMTLDPVAILLEFVQSWEAKKS